MEQLRCTLCKLKKPIIDFYKHNGMPSGYVNQCKECVKARAKARLEILKKDSVWVEKEKERSREKYHRLNYSEKQKIWNNKRPWVNTTTYRNINRDLKISKNQSVHHWNYNLLKDVFVISKKLHRKIHKYLFFDEISLCFKSIEGNLLNTKDKHAEYIKAIINLEKLNEKI